MKRKLRKFLSSAAALLLAVTMLASCAPAAPPDPTPTTPPESEQPDDPTLDIDTEYVVDPITYEDDMPVYKGINDWIAPYEFGAPEQPNVANGKSFQDTVGAVNWGGKYNFTALPYLVEGAEMVSKDLGSSVYKMSLAPNYASMYPYNHEWDDSKITSLKTLASTNDYRTVFNNDLIKTYVMITYEFDTCSWENVPKGTETLESLQPQLDAVKAEFKEVTEYLLATYYDDGKTFILSNWEGDNALGPVLDECKGDEEKEQLAVDAFTAYLNARQDGINEAYQNAAVAASTSKVYGCVEVCHITQDISEYVPNRKRVSDYVVPNTHSDLYSFSDWYSHLEGKTLTGELDYLLSKAPNPNPDFEGKKNIILGEFGREENGEGQSDALQLEISKKKLTEALDWGVQYACYWAYYCNQINIPGDSPRPENDQMAGWWMVRPDGSYSSMFWYVKGLNDGKNYLSKMPKIKITTPEVSKPVPWDANDVIFVDDLSDVSKMKDHSPLATGVDNPLDPTKMDTFGLNFCKPLSKSVFKDFTTYYETYDPSGVNRPLLTDEVFMSYEVKSTNFAFFMYNYNSTGPSLASVEARTGSGEWEKVEGVAYIEYRVGGWGQTYVSVVLEKDKYTEIRIRMNGGSNSWDPIITKVMFLYDGEGENPNPVDPCPDHQPEAPPEYTDPNPPFDPTFNPSPDAVIDWDTAKDKAVFIDDLIDTGRMFSSNNTANADLSAAHFGTENDYFMESMDYSVAGKADPTKTASMVYKARTNRIGVLAGHYYTQETNAIKFYGSVNGTDGWEELPTFCESSGEFRGEGYDPVGVNFKPVYATSVFDLKYQYVKVEVQVFPGGDAFYPSVQRVLFFMGPEPGVSERNWGEETYTAADFLDWTFAKDKMVYNDTFNGVETVEEISVIKDFSNMSYSDADMASSGGTDYRDPVDSTRILRAAAETGYIVVDNKTDIFGMLFYVEHPLSILEKKDVSAYFKIEGMKNGAWVDLTANVHMADQIKGIYYTQNYITLDTAGCSYLRITFTDKGYEDAALKDTPFNSWEQMITELFFY